MAWSSLNDLLLCLVSALGLKDYIGRIYFYRTTHDFKPGNRRPNVWSTDSEC